MYTAGISFSNFQYKYGAPQITSMVLIKSSDLNKIPLIISENVEEKIKERNINNAFYLDYITSLLLPYQDIIKYHQNILEERTPELVKISPQIRILNSYYEIINHYLLSDIKYSINIDLCFLKLPMNKDGIEVSMNEVNNNFHSSFYNFPIIFQRKENSNGLLDLARLYANNTYHFERRKKASFINAVIKYNFSLFKQYIRITWPPVDLDLYNNNFVGYPSFFIKSNDETLIIPYKEGDYFSFFPIAKYCVGLTSNYSKEPNFCLKTNNLYRFGVYIGDRSFELCPTCKKNSKNISFIKKSKIDEEDILANYDEEILDHIYYADYVLYVTLFHDNLKVGLSMKHRLINRLLEESVLDAIVFYPIDGLKLASDLEHHFTKFLKKNQSVLKYSTSERISQKERYENIIQNYRVDNSSHRYGIYDLVLKLLNNTDDKTIKLLSYCNSRTINLRKNWFLNTILPPIFIEPTPYGKIEGKIKGFAGRFILIEDKVYDFKKINGIVGI